MHRPNAQRARAIAAIAAAAALVAVWLLFRFL
jgi:hypothetical protein